MSNRFLNVKGEGLVEAFSVIVKLQTSRRFVAISITTTPCREDSGSSSSTLVTVLVAAVLMLLLVTLVPLVSLVTRHRAMARAERISYTYVRSAATTLMYG